MNKQMNRQSESGNVLFLILIAVALFAALSYAVTKSTRSGGGSTEKEKATLSSAAMTQYPTALRTAIIRMVLNGVSVRSMYFDAPASFGGASTETLVFHPDGGGATYQDAPEDMMVNPGVGTWYFNANFDVPEVGRDGADGSDIIAFLPGVTGAVCEKINREFGITAGSCTMNGAIPQIDAAVTDALISDTLVEPTVTPFPGTGADSPDLQCDSGTAFSGQAAGCFYEPVVGQNVFYAVLLER